MDSNKPEPLHYANIPAPYVYTALDYVTATVNGIVYFFLGWLVTSWVAMLVHGSAMPRGALIDVAYFAGTLVLPLAIAALQFRSVLRQRKRNAMRKRAAANVQ